MRYLSLRRIRIIEILDSYVDGVAGNEMSKIQ